MLPKKPVDVSRVMVGDEAKTEFCSRASGDDALSSRPLIAAANAVYRQRRTQRQPLVKRVTALTPRQFSLRVLEDLIVRRPGTRHVSALLLAWGSDIVIDTGYRDAAICIVEFGDHLA